MDALASIIVDLVLSDDKLPLLLNVVHPTRAPWEDVIKGVNVAARADLPFISYKQWLTRLEEFAAQSGSQELLEKIVSHDLSLFMPSDSGTHSRSCSLVSK